MDNLKCSPIDQEQSFSSLQFEKRDVCNSLGMNCTLILWNGALVLGQQIRSA